MSSETHRPMEKAAGNAKPLPEILNRRMAAYVLAAGAVGITVAARAASGEPPHGPIIFTPMRVSLGNLGTTQFPIDVNQDGITDFFATMTNHRTVVTSSAFSAQGGQLWERPIEGNAAIPKPLVPGALIGSSVVFDTSRKLLGWGDSVNHSGHGGYYFGGPWAGSASDRYMGVRFLINGETHYGWIRMTVTVAPYRVTDFISGYAYNTVANQPIHAGEGAKKPVRAGLHPVTLGVLSLGALGLLLWRKKEREN